MLHRLSANDNIKLVMFMDQAGIEAALSGNLCISSLFIRLPAYVNGVSGRLQGGYVFACWSVCEG